MLIAEVAGVAVIVCATKGKGDDVIHYSSDGDDVFGLAHLTHPVGAEHAAVTLLHACPASEAWGLVLDGGSELRLERCQHGLDGLEASHGLWISSGANSALPIIKMPDISGECKPTSWLYPSL